VRQERTLWTVVGLAAGAVAYVDIRRNLWRSTAALAEAFPSPPPPAPALPADEPVFSARAQQLTRRSWNDGVDRVFGDVVKYLSGRNL